MSCFALITLLSILFSSDALALWGNSPTNLQNLNRLNRGQLKVELHSLQSDYESKLKHRGFGLLRTKSLSFSDGIKNILQSKIKSPLLQIKLNQDIKKSFGLNSLKRSTFEYDFAVGGIPVCDYQVRAHEYSSGKRLVLGSIPDLPASEPTPSSDWPDLEKTFESVIANFQQRNQGTDNPILMKSQKCYSLVADRLLPTWKMWLNIADTGYRITGDEYEIVKLEKLAFDVTGKLTVFESNPKSAVLKTYEMELDGDYRLNNDFFTTNTNTVERARSAGHVFEYDPTDYRFQEASAFVHVALMFEYFRELGYEWKGPKPLEMKLHVIVNSSKNNALYQPAEGVPTGKPTISIGDGDGVVLQNLPLDSDVVSHEFSHHVIYRTLTSVQDESLVLHEGLADYFSNARTGDSCLGESICPGNSLACWIKSECLRSADNSLNFSSDTYEKLESHLKGQIVSGYLWDLHAENEIPSEDVTKLAYEAVALFVSNSGIRDFLLATFIADATEFDGKYCKKLYVSAVERGFDELLTDISCDTGVKSWGVPSGRDSNSGPPSQRKKSSTGGFFSCGTISGLKKDGAGGTSFPILMLLFSLPIILIFAQQKLPIRNSIVAHTDK